MPAYLKKVDAIRFSLSDEQKAMIKSREAVFFEGCPVRHAGGNQYLALLQQGENQHRIFEGQWLVRHIDGLWQILNEAEFNRNFIEAPQENYQSGFDPFKVKSYNQPTMLW